MNVLLVNGSARRDGCTAAALGVVAETLRNEGIVCEIVWVGKDPVRDCTGCGSCRKLDNACVFGDDLVNGLIQKAKAADGFVFGSPVYFSNVSGVLHCLLNRMFYSSASVFRGKPGTALVSARRAGTTAALESLNQYLAYCEMPIVTSSYWNMVHGFTPADVSKDLEGLQTLRNLGRNMAWQLKCLQAAKDAGLEKPANEYGARTHFIR